jgi:uncharacterized damage-inducible protein DinB
MPISQALLPEFDHEMSNTRKTLERIPENDFTWTPHPKSMPLGRLAGHVAEMPGWVVPAIAQDSLDIAPPGSPRPQGAVVQSRQQALELFDKNVADARAAIAGATDEQLMKPWSLLVGGRTIFTMPKIAVLRSMVMNHTIHHRAQLCVYLRLNNIPVPALYGPSADEGLM